MGWAGPFVLSDGREVGYSVEATCDEPGCDEMIDRGMAYLCGMDHGQDDERGCGYYFCDIHLFYGGPNQMCDRCYDEWFRLHPEGDDSDECPDCGFVLADDMSGTLERTPRSLEHPCESCLWAHGLDEVES